MKQCLLKDGLWTSNISITWEVVRNAHSLISHRLTESETLGEGPSNLLQKALQATLMHTQLWEPLDYKHWPIPLAAHRYHLWSSKTYWNLGHIPRSSDLFVCTHVHTYTHIIRPYPRVLGGGSRNLYLISPLNDPDRFWSLRTTCLIVCFKKNSVQWFWDTNVYTTICTCANICWWLESDNLDLNHNNFPCFHFSQLSFLMTSPLWGCTINLLNQSPALGDI